MLFHWFAIINALVHGGSFIDIGNVRHNLDPLSQNIPLPPARQDLRPPPPHIPSTFDIFLGVSSYRDGVRCGFTLFTAYSRAAYPDRVHTGVVDQVLPNDPKCLEEYCKLATQHWGDCKFNELIKIDSRDAFTSTGPVIARYQQQQMIQNEEFCLELDAHTQVLKDWDITLVKEWSRTENEMAILTMYPFMFDLISPEEKFDLNIASHLCDHIKRGAVGDIPYATGILNIVDSEHPQMSAFFGGGFSFGKCHAEKRAPVDQHMKWVFFGEEYLRGYALWTKGYDLYSPSRHGSVVFHNWTTDPNRTLYWKDTPTDVLQAKSREEAMSYSRLRSILKLPFKGEVDLTDIEQYNRGAVRSLDQYLAFTGVSNVNVSLDRERCDQLHWVPYEDPTSIEELLPGWRMYPNNISGITGLQAQLNATHEAVDSLQSKLHDAVENEVQMKTVLDSLYEELKLMREHYQAQEVLIERSHQDSNTVIPQLKELFDAALEKSVNTFEAERGQYQEEMSKQIRDENNSLQKRFFDRIQEQDQVLLLLEKQLKQINDRTSMASVYEVMPSLAIVVGLASIAFIVRCRRIGGKEVLAVS